MKSNTAVSQAPASHALLPLTDAGAASSRDKVPIVFAGLIMVISLAALDQNIVNTALPQVAGDLGGLSHLSWIVTAFMLTSTITTPLYGRLSDMYGRRRLLVTAIAIFLAASALCGLAQSMTQLILSRALQGLGAGGLITLSQTVIADLVAPRDRGRYQGLFTGAFAVSSIAGPVIGGVLTMELSWRWIFYVNLPVGAAALLLLGIGLRGLQEERRRHRIDYRGALLLTATTTCLLLLLSWGGAVYPWASPVIGGLAVVCGLCFFLLLGEERRAPEPILRLALYRNRVVALGALGSGLIGMAMLGATAFLPLYFQLVLGQSPVEAGLMMAPQILCMIASSILGGHLVSWTGRLKPFLMLGVTLEAVSLTALAGFAMAGARAEMFELSLAGLGLGMGIGMPNLTVAVQNAVERGQLGAATSSLTFARALGGATGTALTGGVVAARLQGYFSGAGPGAHAALDRGLMEIARLPLAERADLITAYQHALAAAFAVCGGVMVFTVLLISALPVQSLRSRSAE